VSSQACNWPWPDRMSRNSICSLGVGFSNVSRELGGQFLHPAEARAIKVQWNCIANSNSALPAAKLQLQRKL
jgi:hypothetical protein